MTRLTEEQVERRVERMTDALDRQFMAGIINRKTYDSAMTDLARWADAQLDNPQTIGRWR